LNAVQRLGEGLAVTPVEVNVVAFMWPVT